MTLENDPNVYDKNWIGDEISENRNECIRFWFQNCNGLVKKNDLIEFEYDIAMLADRDVNYISFTETCVNSNKPGYTRSIQDIFGTVIPTGAMKLANSPQYPKRSCYQPGGVAAGFDGTLRTRFLREGMDTLGRWIWHEFGHGQMITRIYTVYRVNAGSETSSGTCTAWFQRKILLEKKGIRSDPRGQIIDDLIDDLKPCIKNGTNIILAGDFNEKLYSPEKLSLKLDDIGLFNVFESTLNTKDVPRTHVRGSGAVDHIWVTKFLLDNIKRAGMAPFGSIYESDHRGMYLDIDENILFDKDEIKVTYKDFRRLQTSIPKRVEKYTKYLETAWRKHAIDKKFEQISTMSLENPDLNKLGEALNKLDKQITEIMTAAEKICTKVSSHHLDSWSPKLIQAMATKRYWKTKLTNASKLPLKIGFVKAIEIYNSTLEKYREAEKEYYEIRKNAKSIRNEFLKERADIIAKTKGTKAAQEINSLIQVEKQRDQSARLKKLKPRQSGGPSTILVPAITEYQRPLPRDFHYHNIEHIWDRIEFDNGEDIINWERITDQSQVQAMLLSWQRKHFTQANETPFASADWRKKLMDNDFQQKLLDGTFEPDTNLPTEVKELLLEMKKPNNASKEISDNSTLEDFKYFIKNIKEKRSSSPSGRHYGHYKIMFTLNEKYLRTIHGILDIALRHSLVLARWTKTVTTLMEKKPGRPMIHKFRAIHIVEGDLQFIAKFFYAHKMIRYAEKHGLISDEQYGGRKNRMAQSVVLNKLCYYNISHQLQMSCAFMDDDARACYDRIVTCLSSAECRKWGLSNNVANFTNKFIEGQKYHVRSAYGISKDSYNYREDSPTQGSGQGLSWAGPRWTNTGTTICNIMKKKYWNDFY